MYTFDSFCENAKPPDYNLQSKICHRPTKLHYSSQFNLIFPQVNTHTQIGLYNKVSQ